MKEELLIKFLNGECSPEEVRFVKTWMEQPDHRLEFDEMLANRWENLPVGSKVTLDEPALLEKIHARLELPAPSSAETPSVEIRPLRRSSSYWLKVAAVVPVLLVSSLLLLHYLTGFTPLAGVFGNQTATQATEVGQKRTVKLPDGSRVVLNSASSLSYSSAFNKQIREVTLQGEAFFEVQADPSRPFIVKTGSVETKAVGTAFNVREHPGGAEVTLREGKVHVALTDAPQAKVAVLKPGEMVVARAPDQQLQVSSADVPTRTAWTQGELGFKSKSLREILDDLEEWYGVRFTVDKKVDLSVKISGEFNNESLENILSGLSFSLNYDFTIRGKKVFITRKE